jgi:hypothetical protein
MRKTTNYLMMAGVRQDLPDTNHSTVTLGPTRVDSYRVNTCDVHVVV